jgi:hypothetical protein
MDVRASARVVCLRFVRHLFRHGAYLPEDSISRGEHGVGETSAAPPADMSDDVADGLQLCLFVGSMPGPTLCRSFRPGRHHFRREYSNLSKIQGRL